MNVLFIFLTIKRERPRELVFSNGRMDVMKEEMVLGQVLSLKWIVDFFLVFFVQTNWNRC